MPLESVSADRALESHFQACHLEVATSLLSTGRISTQ